MKHQLIRHLLTTFTAAAAVLAPFGVVHAADPEAEALYQEGRRAAVARDWALACKKFEESERREAAPGTLLNLADCEENRGHLAAALEHFEAAVRMFAPGNPRAAYASDRAAAVEKRVAKLTVRLHPPLTAAGATVERDGAVMDLARLGTPMRVDPGEHVFIVRSSGHAEVRSAVVVAPGESREIELGGESPVTATTPPLRRSSAHGEESEGTPIKGEAPKTHSALRTGGIVALGASGVALAVGVVGGLVTINAKSTADAHCPTNGCDAEGLAAESRGKTWSTVSTVGFAAFGVGLLTGVGLLVLAPPPSRSSDRTTGTTGVSVQPITNGAAVSWAGRF